MNTTSNKSKRGGKREGAGRPKRTIPAKTISVSVDADVADHFRRICREQGISQSKQIAEWVMLAVQG